MSKPNYPQLLKAVNELVFDPDFITLSRYAVSTSILDLKTFKENDVSNVLAWLLDPREGHLQSDYFLKSLIAAIYQKANDEQLAELPQATKMSLCSLSNIKVMQEVHINQSQSRRIDLLLADLDAKVLIVIERKDGSSAHSGQLKDYYNWAQENYDGWHKLFVLSDSHQRNHGKNAHASFVQLDDGWLGRALLELIQKDRLPAHLEYTFRDIHDYIFAEWHEKRDPFYKGYDALLKQVAQRHAEILRSLRENTIKLGKKSERLINISPALYFSHILIKPEKYSEQVRELCGCIQSFHETISELADLSEFNLLAGQITELYPDISVYFSKEHVDLVMKRHVVDERHWPYYLNIVPDKTNEDKEVFYIVCVGGSRKCNEKMIPVAEVLAKVYGYEGRSNWMYNNTVIEAKLTDLSLDDGSRLRVLLDDFYENIRKL